MQKQDAFVVVCVVLVGAAFVQMLKHAVTTCWQLDLHVRTDKQTG